jgi:hypothetical protein
MKFLATKICLESIFQRFFAFVLIFADHPHPPGHLFFILIFSIKNFVSYTKNIINDYVTIFQKTFNIFLSQKAEGNFQFEVISYSEHQATKKKS